MSELSMTNLSTALDNVPELRRVKHLMHLHGDGPYTLQSRTGESFTCSLWEINNVKVEVLHLEGRTMFNATMLRKTLSAAKRTTNNGFVKDGWFGDLVNDFRDDIVDIKLKGQDRRLSKNVFVDWFHLAVIARGAEPRAYSRWLLGKTYTTKRGTDSESDGESDNESSCESDNESSSESRTSGWVYLVQSSKDRGTTIFKVGQTMNVKGRMDQYGKDRLELRVVPVTDRCKAEERLKDAFKGFELVRGNEFYECRSIELAIEAWDRVWSNGLVDKMFVDANEARDSDDLPPFQQLRELDAARARSDNEGSSSSE